MGGKKYILWWSGGVTSAVACYLAIDLFNVKNCRVIMIDTFNEDVDTYRFKKDCEKWYGLKIETISAIGKQYDSIQDTWLTHLSLNVAAGAICSYKLKRVVREKWQKTNEYTHQVFGFEFEKREFNRAMSLSLNHPSAKPIFPLIMYGYDKTKCFEVLNNAGIEVPNAYKMGFGNNNCLATGCVQGGIGYWKKMQIEFPKKFKTMAKLEHKLTDFKGSPVTMLKDQSQAAKKVAKKKQKNGGFTNLVFLVKHKNYPNLKSIDDMTARTVKPLIDCNGFCGVNDMNGKSETENELNFENF